jgi:hypothetical protein
LIAQLGASTRLSDFSIDPLPGLSAVAFARMRRCGEASSQTMTPVAPGKNHIFADVAMIRQVTLMPLPPAAAHPPTRPKRLGFAGGPSFTAIHAWRSHQP